VIGGDGHQRASTGSTLRRKHTKSRDGCRGCKARKVKCDEIKPTCTNCAQRGATCEYAGPPSRRGIIHGSASTRAPVFVSNLSAVDFAPRPAETRFSLQEMRFFHHFIIAVPHPLPLGSRSVWSHEIPQIAHQHPYLMHGILALGATELKVANPNLDIDSEILRHRGLALAGLQGAMKESSTWSAAGYPDAVLATCYTLLAQTSRMADAIADFNVAVQGCALVTRKLREERIRTVFPLDRADLERQLCQRLTQQRLDLNLLPSLRPSLDALIQLRESCTSSVLPFVHAMARAASVYLRAPSDAYTDSMRSFCHWYELAPGIIEALLDPAQDVHVMLAVFALFFGNMVYLKILVPVTAFPELRAKKSHKDLPINAVREVGQWLQAIHQSIPHDLQKHLEWPFFIVRSLPRTIIKTPALRGCMLDGVATKVDIILNMKSHAHKMLGSVLTLASDLASWFETQITASNSRDTAATSLSQDDELQEIDGPSSDLDTSVMEAPEFPFLLFSTLR
jgi:hypothetical protein